MKKMICLCMVIVFAGCDDESKNISNKYDMPPGLNNCNVYYIHTDSHLEDLYVVKCKDSSIVSTQYDIKDNDGNTIKHVSTTIK